MGDLDERPQADKEGENPTKVTARIKEFVGGIKIDRIKNIMLSKDTRKTAIACILGLAVAGGSIYYYNYKTSGKDAAVTAAVAESGVQSQTLMAKETVPVEVAGFAITVNGEEIAILGSEEEAKSVISQVEDHFKSEEKKNGAEVLDMVIKDDIQFLEKLVKPSKIVDAGTVVDKLLAGKGVTKEYVVEKGDSIWEIAKEYDMKIQEIAAINPDLNPEKIQIGDVVYLSVSEPYINVETTVKVEVEEKIPYETKYVSDNKVYKGDTKVVESGKSGTKKVVREITKLNGKEIENTVLASTVLKDPVTKVVAKGTKPLVGSGNFRWPVSGTITSKFGSRGGGYHRGLDIGAKKGTAIYAADGGTVTYAGWYYGYGYLVKVSHGNGYETWYGHCSKMYVKKGQTVKKGSKIAAVGSTGNSTGPHLHFEVRKNGTAKNPLNYLD